MQNPFKPAQAVSKKLKILLYGASGSGKTLAALSFPKVALIDAEGGADLYSGRPGVQPFDILRTKTVTDLENAVRFIQEDNGKTYQTLVIDPITVFYDVAREAAARAAKSGDMGFKEWAKLNNRMKSVYNALTNLPVHVVIIARQAVEYDGAGLDLKKIGVKPDADKALPYMADFVIRLQADHTGVVEKSRGTTLLKGDQTAVNWSIFQPIAESFSAGETITQVSEDDAAANEAESMQDRDVATAFMTYWRDQSLTDTDILTALNISRLSQWPNGRKSADDKVRTWLDEQLKAKAAANGAIATDPKVDPSVSQATASS